jgi:hypothetical protein
MTPSEQSDTGKWTIIVEGGPAFAQNAVLALRIAAAEKRPGPTRECFDRLGSALAEAVFAPSGKKR